MKIGEFSKKNNITQDTIRHYIDMGLLVAEKQGWQYKFSEEDSNDLEKITMLKQLDFSLTEIQEILCFNRVGGEKTDEFRNFYLSLLERKKDEIMKEQQRFKEIDSELKDRINELKMYEINARKNLGFPLSSTGLLHCPCCKQSLEISDGIVEKSMLIEATVHCACGYIAFIENGIYIDKKAVRTKIEIPPKKTFLEVTSPKFVNFMYNGTTTVIDYILNHGNAPKYIMELDNCVGRFLMQYIDYLPKGCTYILICHDKERITSMKENLMQQHEHSNFIFFCCDIDQLPLADSSMDIIIDHWMSRIYAKSTHKSVLDIVSPFLKEEGLLTGAYPHIGTKSKDFINIPLELRDYFNRNKILERLEQLNYSQLEGAEIGPVIENNPYIDLNDKEQYLTLYAGRKRSQFDRLSPGTEFQRKQRQHLIPLIQARN